MKGPWHHERIMQATEEGEKSLKKLKVQLQVGQYPGFHFTVLQNRILGLILIPIADNGTLSEGTIRTCGAF
jgi:hypothetical protein